MAHLTHVSQAAEHPLNYLPADFDALVNRLFHGNAGVRLAPYAVDVREDADHIFVEAELPGFTRDEVDITLENSVLTISAERKAEQQTEKKGEYLLNERRYARFLRSFTLPPTVNESSVEAGLKDGVLTITIKKREETKPRKITVS
jgi:HSP20 family protein